MWTRKQAITFGLSFFFCFSLACVGGCSEARAETEPTTITISKEDWNRLKQNNEEQQKALIESRKELTEARQELAESRKASTEARELLEISQMTSTEAQEKLLTLLEEFGMQKEEISKLRAELTAQRAELKTAYESIEKANHFLNDTKKEIEANEAAWRKRENQLERQRLEWQIASVLLGYIGYEIGRH